ncbi:MAG: hypothetical protein ABIK07_26490, partial [Planctomycetota bacterium]
GNLIQSGHQLGKAPGLLQQKGIRCSIRQVKAYRMINFSVSQEGSFQAGLMVPKNNQLSTSIRTISAREFKMFAGLRAVV